MVLCALDTVGFVLFEKAVASWELQRNPFPLGRRGVVGLMVTRAQT